MCICIYIYIHDMTPQRVDNLLPRAIPLFYTRNIETLSSEIQT